MSRASYVDRCIAIGATIGGLVALCLQGDAPTMPSLIPLVAVGLVGGWLWARWRWPAVERRRQVPPKVRHLADYRDKPK